MMLTKSMQKPDIQSCLDLSEHKFSGIRHSISPYINVDLHNVVIYGLTNIKSSQSFHIFKSKISQLSSNNKFEDFVSDQGPG